jgi:esterase/lipase
MKGQKINEDYQDNLLLHGFYGTGAMWNDNYKKELEKVNRNCITPTLPGHNIKDPSNKRIETLGIQDYLNFLEKIIVKLKQPPNIIGFSMGGLLALKLAEMGLAKKVILLNPAPPRWIIAINRNVYKSFSEVLKFGFWNKPHKLSFEKAQFAMLNHIENEDEQREFYDSFVPESGKAALDIIKGVKVDKNKINCKVHVIGSNNDNSTPKSHKVANKYGTTFDSFNSGHHIMFGPGSQEITRYVVKKYIL